MLLRAVEKDKLPIALKGASEKLRDMFFNNMSDRAGKMLKRRHRRRSARCRLRDVDEAQAGIVGAGQGAGGAGPDRDRREQGRGDGVLTWTRFARPRGQVGMLFAEDFDLPAAAAGAGGDRAGVFRQPN